MIVSFNFEIHVEQRKFSMEYMSKSEGNPTLYHIYDRRDRYTQFFKKQINLLLESVNN